MVEECGARFEKLKVIDCTHLITTKRSVQDATRKGEYELVLTFLILLTTLLYSWCGPEGCTLRCRRHRMAGRFRAEQETGQHRWLPPQADIRQCSRELTAHPKLSVYTQEQQAQA